MSPDDLRRMIDNRLREADPGGLFLTMNNGSRTFIVGYYPRIAWKDETNDEILTEDDVDDDTDYDEVVDGFLTRDSRFISRKDALALAAAANPGLGNNPVNVVGWADLMYSCVWAGFLIRPAEYVSYSLTTTPLSPNKFQVVATEHNGLPTPLSSYLRSRLGKVVCTDNPPIWNSVVRMVDRINTMLADGAAVDPTQITIEIHRGAALANAYANGCWGHTSCMTGKANVHKIRVYQINPQVVGLAQILKADRTIARTLIWGTEDGPKFYDRIYSLTSADDAAAAMRALETAGYRAANSSALAVVMKLPVAGMNIPYFDHMSTGARIGEDRMVVISRGGGTAFSSAITKKFNISQWGEFKNQHGVLGMIVRTIDGVEAPVSQVRQFPDCGGNVVYVDMDNIDAERRNNNIVPLWLAEGTEVYVNPDRRNNMYQHPSGGWFIWFCEDLPFLYLKNQFVYKDPKNPKRLCVADTISRGGLRIPYRKDRIPGDYPVYKVTPMKEDETPIGYIPKSLVTSMRLPTQLLGGTHYILVGDGDWDDAAARDARHIPAEVIVG